MARFILCVVLCSTACVPKDIALARDFVESGDLYQALRAFEVAEKNHPHDPAVQKEVALVRESFLKEVLTKDVAPVLERLDYAIGWLTNSNADAAEVRQYLTRKFTVAQDAGQWLTAVDAALALAQPERAAWILHVKLPPTEARTELGTLFKKFPQDAGVCGEWAAFLTEQGDKPLAIATTQQCRRIKSRTPEQDWAFEMQLKELGVSGKKAKKR